MLGGGTALSYGSIGLTLIWVYLKIEYPKTRWVWVKIGYPDNWMVNTKLD